MIARRRVWIAQVYDAEFGHFPVPKAVAELAYRRIRPQRQFELHIVLLALLYSFV